jgi:hypothetical protein
MASIDDPNGALTVKRQARGLQFGAKCIVINTFGESGPQGGMNANSASDGSTDQFL